MNLWNPLLAPICDGWKAGQLNHLVKSSPHRFGYLWGGAECAGRHSTKPLNS